MDVKILFDIQDDNLNKQAKDAEKSLEHTAKDAEDLLKKAKEDVVTLTQKTTALLAFANGVLSLYQATAGETADELVQVLLSSAQSTVSLFAAYAAIGAASGNLALVARVGVALGSVASVINSINGISRYIKRNREKEERRQSNLSY